MISGMLAQDMGEAAFNLAKAPIVEMVVDVNCDMPPGFDLVKLKDPARERFRDRYPTTRVLSIQGAQIEAKADGAPEISVLPQAVQAIQFFDSDEKQLVQARQGGFSFNRLAPYSSLDDYLPEIERTWRLFAELTSPVQIRAVQLRYINRILIPTVAGRVPLDDYFSLGPRVPDEDKLTVTGFLNQYTARETDTGNTATVVLTAQAPENDRLPIIFDISVVSQGDAEPGDWDWISARIASLRGLKNHIFKNTLTEQCLKLFQQNSQSAS